MDELERRVGDVRPARAEPEWSEGHEQALRTAVERSLSEKRARRAPMAFAAVAVAVAAAAALPLWLASGEQRGPWVPAAAAASAAAAAAAPNPAVLFTDGSRAEAISSDMRVEAVVQGSGRIEARLLAGAARFDVVRDPSREFIVHAGNVNVSVLGTVFTVANEGARVHVAVMDGRVHVDWGSGSTTLLQDGQGVFPPSPETAGEHAVAEAAADTRPSHANSAKQRWVELAKAGDFKSAYTRLAEAGSAGVADVPEVLLLAADVSRRAGHIDQAARHLERLLARYPRDTRAGVAAFTLGRIRLQLGKPAAAGSAFEQVASSGGALAEDAMYRAVMAFRQAGDPAKAARVQARYLATYPAGRYADVLQEQP